MGYNHNIRKIIRKNFGKNLGTAQIPNLIEVQRNSYKHFLQSNNELSPSTVEGLEKVFRSVFPIEDYQGRVILEFIGYSLEKPKYDVEECQQRGLTYDSPLKITLRLVVFDIDEDTEAKSVRNIKEQDVFICDIPLMNDNGTFIINGTERVIVSQMHRSPGVLFDHDKGRTHSSGKLLFVARISPNRGSWIDIEFDHKDIIYVRIDRKRKFLVTTLLKAMGLSAEDILTTFYDVDVFTKTAQGWSCPFDVSVWQGAKLSANLVDAKTGNVVMEKNKRVTQRVAKKLAQEGLENVLLQDEDLFQQYLAQDVVNLETGAIYAEAGEEITEELLAEITADDTSELKLLRIDHAEIGAFMVNTLALEKNFTQDDALQAIHRILRPGEPTTVENSKAMFNAMFFDPEYYDLSPVGRVKLNMRLDMDVDETVCTLRHEDILETIKELIRLREGKSTVDDIDHMGNRRIRSVGELMENQFYMGLARMEKAIKERMSSVDLEIAMPQDLINSKALNNVIREFFGTSQLSQFMDQTNPLSEITHKRRLSALGPGGLNRERAGFEVRDVHTSHYGRVCPVESPEGPNIGLINSLATFARINRYGFIESSYNKVIEGKVTNEVQYMSAIEEGKYYIASSDSEVDKNNNITSDVVLCRKDGEVQLMPKNQIGYIDVSPKQVVSVAASLIPFLENDDANRALMGSNMQRQAVPLISCEAPIVGTGMESVVAKDSGVAIVAKRSGIVDQVDATRIVVKVDDEDISHSLVDIYNLRKFQRSNQNTCINQRPLVRVGDVVKQGEIIADGPAIDRGDLALGRNVMVAFMPWNGYNFEDSILISEKIVQDDVFTSIHIEEFEVVARDTKLGPEEITRDIPNVGEEGLRNLDESGIVYIGAEVNPGDIMVGKITSKGESPMTPEEKLLRAIFGEKASEVRDSSLRVPPGVTGTVLEVRIFNRHGIEKDERALAIEREKIEKFSKDKDDEQYIYDRNVYGRLSSMLVGEKVASQSEHFQKNDILTEESLSKVSRSHWWNIGLDNEELMKKLVIMHEQYESNKVKLNKHFLDKVEKVQQGDDMAPGVMKIVKVFVAVKRKLQPGDKMAGRHGNKGVVSKIVPVEDMPYMDDGTPVDIVLNPLGVPSRMNVGQILETHLGWAAAGMAKKINKAVEEYQQQNHNDVKALRQTLLSVYNDAVDIENMSDGELLDFAKSVHKGIHTATPIFDGAKEEEISQLLIDAGLDSSGQITLYDGLTGESFDRPVTVGYIYMLKLHHLVDEKIHSRSIGPYSLVTQQPLGGKAQFGGQRFGEMEVWALEAYGAAYTLQEILTVKSDDVAGRTKVYEAIVRGEDSLESGIPESFNVLIKEIRSLGLDIDLRENYGHND